MARSDRSEPGARVARVELSFDLARGAAGVDQHRDLEEGKVTE